MNRFFILSAAFLALFCLCQPTLAQKWKCNSANEKEADEIVARIMTYGQSNRKFPVNKVELKEYCKEQSQLVSRLEDYKNHCLKNRPKQIVSVIVYSIKQLISTYCKNFNSKRVTDLINSAPCANKATHEYNKCSIEYIDRLIASQSIKEPKDRLAQSCCGYVRVSSCVREKAAPFGNICDEQKVEANINYIRGFFDNAVDVICGDYNENSDKCDRVRPAVLKKKKNQKRPKSFFNPLVKILSEI